MMEENHIRHKHIIEEYKRAERMKQPDRVKTFLRLSLPHSNGRITLPCVSNVLAKAHTHTRHAREGHGAEGNEEESRRRCRRRRVKKM